MVTLKSRQEQLEGDPKIEGWLAWYWILPGKSGEESVLVGNGGFKGPPTQGGIAEIGYYLRPTHHGRGYGIEAVRCLLEHVFSHAGVRLVMAETRRHNIASVRLLQKVGFGVRGQRL
jgi:RimJ/RimL family protein N-acetyltransferase